MLYNTFKKIYKDDILKDEELLKDIASDLSKTQNRKWEHGSLEYRFTDSDGLKYYAFPTELELPLSRFIQMRTYATWFESNLTKENLRVIVDKINKLLEEGISKLSRGQRVNMVKIAALTQEIVTRDEMIKDPDLIYNLICIQLVREDEDPGVFDESIHQQKVSKCMEEIKEGNTFFLQTLEYKRVIDYSTMSPSDWVEYLKRSMEEKAKWEKAIQSM